MNFIYLEVIKLDSTLKERIINRLFGNYIQSAVDRAVERRIDKLTPGETPIGEISAEEVEPEEQLVRVQSYLSGRVEYLPSSYFVDKTRHSDRPARSQLFPDGWFT